MPNTVSRRAPVRKSRSQSATKNPTCPTCKGPLVVRHDSDDLTTLICPRCARERASEWLTSAESEDVLNSLVKKYRKLAKTDADDYRQDVILAVLESADAPEGEAAFAAWLDAVAKRVAVGRWREELGQVKAVDGEVLQAVAEDGEEVGSDLEPEFVLAADAVVAWDKEKKARAARVRRVLAKLSEGQRAAVKAKFFQNKALSRVAAEADRCDSAERMQWLRAKRKLSSLLTPDGYAVSA